MSESQAWLIQARGAVRTWKMATVQHSEGVYVSSDEAQAALVSGTKIEVEKTIESIIN